MQICSVYHIISIHTGILYNPPNLHFARFEAFQNQLFKIESCFDYWEKLKPKPRYLFTQKFYKNATNAYLQKKITNMKLTTLLNNHNTNNNWDLNWVNTELSVIRSPWTSSLSCTVVQSAPRSKTKKCVDLDRNRQSWLVKLVDVNRRKLEKKLKISHPRDKMGKSVFYDTLGLEQ